jgi:hypothetical protein
MKPVRESDGAALLAEKHAEADTGTRCNAEWGVAGRSRLLVIRASRPIRAS